jgi:small subunit ribosomal protein S16
LIRIRLARVGKRKQPTYRLVVTDRRSPRDGRFIEILGHYNPLRDPVELEFDADRARDWLAKGAQPSEAAARLLASRGVGEAPPRPAGPQKPSKRKAAAESAPVVTAPAAPPKAADEGTAAPPEPATEPASDQPAAEAPETADQAEPDTDAPPSTDSPTEA